MGCLREKYIGMIITRRIEIYPAEKESWKFMRDINYQVWKAANRIVSEQFFNDRAVERLKMSNPDLSAKDIDAMFRVALGYSVRSSNGGSKQNTTFAILKDEFPELPSDVRSALNAQVVSVYRKELKEIYRGDRSIRNYRKDLPIPFTSKMFRLHESGESFTWYGHEWKFRYGRDRSNNRLIVDRILDGTYKMCDSTFMFKKNKLFVNLVIDIPAQDVELDADVIVGVDLGINVPAYVAVNQGPHRKAIGDRDDFLAVRLRLQEQRRRLQRNLKFTNGGKGRKKKLQRLDNLEARERNMVKTMNHQISKEVVDFALKCKAATIHIEDLSGFGRTDDDAKKKFFLRNWSYFELQQFIAYKAEKHGIEVVKVPAAYTSQHCAECGSEAEDQYDPYKAVFECKNPQCNLHGKKVHGDYNAAKKIARYHKIEA